MIHQIHLHTGHSIRMICEVFGLPRSSLSHAGRHTASQLSDQEIGEHIERIFRHHRCRYGYRRIYRELIDHGIVCGQTRVRRLMAQRGLKAIQPKTFVPRASDGKASRPSPKLLLEKGVPTKNGWIYLAVVIYLCSRRIVGWALADHLRADLVAQAFRQAWQTRRPQLGLIFHSDRGRQYDSRLFRQLLKKAGAIQSMSARANPCHNAWTESFIGTLKNEMLQGGCFIDADDARTELFAYIGAYYNTHRRHSSLNDQPLVSFEANFYSKK